MARYSIGMDRVFRPKVTSMATFVEAPSMSATVKGPTNLQIRSIRRIRALSAARLVSIAQTQQYFSLGNTGSWVDDLL